MNPDPLSRFAAALAEENDGAVPVPSVTRERILASIETNAPKRRLRLAWHAPLWLALVGSTAWASQHGPLRAWLAEQVAPDSMVLAQASDVPGGTARSDAAPSEQAKGAPGAVADGVPAAGAAPAAPQQGSQGSAQLDAAQQGSAQLDAAQQGSPQQGRSPSSVGGTSLSVSTTPLPEPSRPVLLGAEPTSGSASSGQARDPSSAAPAGAPGADALALYRRAHDAQFKSGSYATALDGYRRYLSEFPNGEFAPEARYNSAICLLNVGRREEAREILSDFAAGVYGEYRRERASELLDALAND